MEHSSIDVQAGKQIGEEAYARRAHKWRELRVGPIIIDHYDPKARLIKEVKKSPKLEHAHIAQVQYYQWHLERSGISNSQGVIEYPKQRQKTEIPPLTDAGRDQIEAWLQEIDRLCLLPTAPKAVRKPYCKRCAYFELCYV